MSRFVRKQLFHMLETMQTATFALQKVLANGTAQELQDLLNGNQECAIALGNQIEKLYGEDTNSVSVLENYCENLYQLSIASDHPEEQDRIYSLLCSQLSDIKSLMEQEIPDKTEVVFLPYKASMWDSLESVWLAARDDESCEDYVIPIPYYDKNPDGTLNTEHYEGGEYPDYVPITSYKSFDFELHHPDIIYIHNPYDNGNFVTSVHPFFYSKNLKQYTEKLVYIPYFVLEEIDSNNQAAVNKIKHFCTTAAVLNADKVILQSENMKTIYVNVLTELMGNTKEARQFWEAKIEGTGSPKLDKIARTKKEDVKIPEEWMKYILKPDGSHKKIVLYNTTIAAFLEENEKMLAKIESVLEIFKENKEDITLLWRPHPLLEETVSSMRPQLKAEYDRIKEQYIKEDWGIFDDTADMNRAVAMSDAYYGDRSSMVRLYQQMEKMILIQDCSI